MVDAQGLAERLRRARESPAYANYELVRDKVLSMRALEPRASNGGSLPSGYWRSELESFEYMLDASPLVIERLREHTFHITGVKTYDYRQPSAEARRRFAAKLHALAALEGDELLVPERPELGGFGYELDGGLYNLDTLKFFECLIALQRAGVLGALRERPSVVWEIGAGWGGFAYQFKTLCPQATYLIVDLPELFLFSAVYLMTLFPGARVRFWEGQSHSELLSSLDEVDFVFIPAAALDSMRPPRLDLTINMVSFQEMTTAQVDSYVERAHELNCPYLYSLNRDRSPHNPELSSVKERIARRFWLHTIPVLDVPYQRPLDHPPFDGRLGRGVQLIRKRLRGGPSAEDYEHVMGWRRAET